MKNLILKLSVLCCLALLASHAYAQDLPKQNAIPGGLVILKIESEANSLEPTVYFEKKRVTLIAQQVMAKNAKPTQVANKEWIAVVGIPLSTSPGEHSVMIYWPSGNKSKKNFTVKSFDYPEQRLTIKDDNKVNPSEKEMQRIWKETAQIQKAKSSWLENTPHTTMQLPVQGPLSSQFGLKRFFNDKPRNPHSGLDIAAAEGTPIIAPADGTIVETGDFFFSGKCIFIDHGKGVISFYGHMSRIDVKPGEKIAQGKQLGLVGKTGRVTGPHLHWSIGLNETWVDPSLFLKH